MTEIAVIALLGVATYATRAGGFWLTRKFRPTPFIEAWLNHIPGAVFMALVAPMVLEAGPTGWSGAVAGFLAMRRTNNFFLAIVIGMLVFLFLRWAFSSLGAI